jgi:hypothetical protein
MDHLSALKTRMKALDALIARAEQDRNVEAIGNLSWEQMRTEDRIARIEHKLRRRKVLRRA